MFVKSALFVQGLSTIVYLLSFKGNNFYIRGYYTSNNSGQSYDLTRTGALLNDIAGSVNTYAFNYYDKFYVEGKTHKEAIAYAGRNRLKPGSSNFRNSLEKITNKLIGNGGSGIFRISESPPAGDTCIRPRFRLRLRLVPTAAFGFASGADTLAPCAATSGDRTGFLSCFSDEAVLLLATVLVVLETGPPSMAAGN